MQTVLSVASVTKGVTTGFVADYEKEITFSLVEYVSLSNSFYVVPGTANSCEASAVDMSVTALSSSSFRVTFDNVGMVWYGIIGIVRR